MRLRESLKAQTLPNWKQLIVTDNGVKVPEHCFGDSRITNITHPEQICKPNAPGAAARAIGLIWATTPYVTFCDDDCWFEDEHLEWMLHNLREENVAWGWGLRRIWTNSGRYLGVDRFESYGEDSKTPYKMAEMNATVMQRQLGVKWAAINRDIATYDEDRRLYQWLRDDPATGDGFASGIAGLNQVCPRRLEMMFEEGCSAE